MKLSTALALLLLGSASMALGVLMQRDQNAAIAGVGQKLLPGVAAQLGQATRIELQDATHTSTLVLQDGQWGLAERDFYPVPVQKIRTLFSALTDLTQTEPRTANPALLGRLGLAPPSIPGSTGTALRVLDAHGVLLANIILGHRISHGHASAAEQIYARQASEPQSWLTEGKMDVSADPQSWLEREIVNIPRAQITSITVLHGQDQLDFSRIDGKMTLANPPAGKLDDVHVEEMAANLEELSLADVKHASPPGAPIGSAVFTTTSGLAITVSLTKQDDIIWSSVLASGPGAAAYSHLAGWAFQLSPWRVAMVPTPSDMILAEPAKPLPAPAAAPVSEPDDEPSQAEPPP